MKLIIKKNYEEVSKEAANILINEVNLYPSLTIGFATGSTPLGVYKELIDAYKRKKVDFSKITSFNLDEYYPITKEDSQSYYYFMRTNLFNHINIPKENINMLNGLAKDPEKECEKYEEKLKISRPNVQILGIGSNGHIAFNEPGSSFSSKTRKIILTDKTRKDNSRFFDNEDDVPKFALTMGLDTIFKSKKIILLAAGIEKAKAIKKLLEEDINPACPASILRKHKNTTIIVDEAAASLLTQTTLPSSVNGYKILTQEHMPENKKIVIISPHPDDSCINAGGTILKLSSANKIDILIMTTGHRADIPGKNKEEKTKIREDEVKKECIILEATPHFCRLGFYDNEPKIKEDLKKISALLNTLKPDIIMLPHKKDVHPTHITSRKITLESLKTLDFKPELWSYETTWALFKDKEFNTIVSLNSHEMKQKLDAIACHESQLNRTRYDLAAKALGQLRAALIPEQALAEFGKNSIKLDKYVELLNIESQD